MKSFISLTLLCSVCFSLSAQKFHINTFIGIANYQGDLQDKRFTFSQARFALGAGLSYELTEKVFLRGGLTIGKVTSDDKQNSRNLIRNLNFTSSLTEGHLALEYYFKNLNEYSFSPYIFAGVAVYHFVPSTKDSNGVKYNLKPLSTEGEGFYQNRKYYNLTQFAIPFGGGFKFVLTDNIHIGVEIGMRKLFTDYLDDVSTTYVDHDLLLANREPKAVELAFRGGELKNGSTYPADGSTRGGSKYKDWYYFTGLTTSFRLGGGAGNTGSGKGSGKSRKGVGCPTGIY
jgi:opacity protein-like surface antigen